MHAAAESHQRDELPATRAGCGAPEQRPDSFRVNAHIPGRTPKPVRGREQQLCARERHQPPLPFHSCRIFHVALELRLRLHTGAQSQRMKVIFAPLNNAKRVLTRPANKSSRSGKRSLQRLILFGRKLFLLGKRGSEPLERLAPDPNRAHCAVNVLEELLLPRLFRPCHPRNSTPSAPLVNNQERPGGLALKPASPPSTCTASPRRPLNGGNLS